MTEQSQDLQQQFPQQALQRAQTFYGQSLGNFKSQIHNDRGQLEQLSQQLPEGAEKSQMQEMIDSYNQVENFMYQAAQDQGVEDTMSQASSLHSSLHRERISRRRTHLDRRWVRLSRSQVRPPTRQDKRHSKRRIPSVA